MTRFAVAATFTVRWRMNGDLPTGPVQRAVPYASVHSVFVATDPSSFVHATRIPRPSIGLPLASRARTDSFWRVSYALTPRHGRLASSDPSAGASPTWLVTDQMTSAMSSAARRRRTLVASRPTWVSAVGLDASSRRARRRTTPASTRPRTAPSGARW